MAWAPDYATVAEVKAYCNLQDNRRDQFVASWITTASRNVDDFCARQFGQTASEARTFEPVYDRRDGEWFTEVDDTFTSTPTLADADGNALTDFVLLPRNAPQKGRPYERIRSASGGEVTVTAAWGWPAVPAAVKTGLLIQAARLNKRIDSPFGIASTPAEGSDVRLLAQLDPDFRTSLRPLQRKWWAA